MNTLPPVSNEVQSEDDDYSISMNAVMQRRASTRKSKRLPSIRRASSPFTGDLDSLQSIRTGSGDTVISVDEATNSEEMYELLKLHKEVLSAVKTQPWPMRRKLRLVETAHVYVRQHEGALKQKLAASHSTRDVFKRYRLLIGKKWKYYKREMCNVSKYLIPWEMRIKNIESHFGSVVASYFTFLRWLLWVNLIITLMLVVFVVVPEMVIGGSDPQRKEMLEEERNVSTRLMTAVNFEGPLKYSPLFYGYYTNQNGSYKYYRLPLAYFLTGLVIYVFSFAAILRKMAKNSRMSKLSEKDEECIFTWKLFVGWDHMIGNAETAHNRIASLVLGFKEALLEEAEKKREDKNWKIIVSRIFVNVVVVGLLITSAYAVIIVVKRSTEEQAKYGWWRQNEITFVLSIISSVFPIFFELLGMLEYYHPRKQLRFQLARIMVLNLLNLYSLTISLFDKIDDMTKESREIRMKKFHMKITAQETTLVNFPPSTMKAITALMLISSNLSHSLLNNSSNVTIPGGTFNGKRHLLALNLDYNISGEFPVTFEEEFQRNDSFYDYDFITKVPSMESNERREKEAVTATMETVTETIEDLITEPYDQEFSYVTNQTDEYTVTHNQTEENEAKGSTEQSIFTEDHSMYGSSGFTDSRDDWSSEESSTATYEASEATTSPASPRLSEKPEVSEATFKSTGFNEPSTMTSEMNQVSSITDFSTFSASTTTPLASITPKSTTYDADMEKKLRSLCWETMFGQEMMKLTIMDLIFNVFSTLTVDFFRAIFVRYMNPCCCWDLEKKFPQYGDFKIAENILHLINNQGMIWMGLFFSPGLALVNLGKLLILMYLKSWAISTCNVPHEVVFRASRSNNFYFALLLTMLFLCVLPVSYVMVRIEPSWHCGPFSNYNKTSDIFTETLYQIVPDKAKPALEYIASPGIVIPLLVLLILIIYYLTSLTNALREANLDLKIQLRHERTEERRKMFEIADKRFHKSTMATINNNKWRRLLGEMTKQNLFKTSADKAEVGRSDDRKKEKLKNLINSTFVTSVPVESDGTDTDQQESLTEDKKPTKEEKKLDPVPVITISKTESSESVLTNSEDVDQRTSG